MTPSFPTPSPPSLKEELRISALLRAQFLTDPDAVCSLINSHQPNLVLEAGATISVALGPGATTTISGVFPPGFVHVYTTVDFFTDIPFAIRLTIVKDGVIMYTDPGLVPLSYRFRNWLQAASNWQAVITNTSAVDVNVHTFFGGWHVEAKTFGKIMSIIKPLAFALADYGTPEGELINE